MILDDKKVNRGFACTLKNIEQLQRSTSGGVFFAVAKRVLEQGGIVYGAAYDENLNIIHQSAENLLELEKLRKSKYVQSNIKNSYKDIKEHLLKGRKVLISGTPCQAAGLTKFLKMQYDNLIIIQVFCSGVIVTTAWKKYIEDLSKELKQEIIEYESRYKIMEERFLNETGKGWKYPHIRIKTKDGQEYILSRENDSFTIAYAKHLAILPSCANCKFKLKSNNIYADLSIGDFWGCENNAPEVFHSMGVSAVITHSDKGLSILETLKNEMTVMEVDVNIIYRGNPGACYPYKNHPDQEKFLKQLSLNEKSFYELVQEYTGFGNKIAKANYKFGIFGSYNLRASVMELCSNSQSKLIYQYSNCSIISLMSPAVKLPKDIAMPTNPFREKMVKADFNKEFLSILSCETIDFLFIDFLEERFGVIPYQNSFITVSEALNDTNFVYQDTISLYDCNYDLWKEKYNAFLDFLKTNFNTKKIILLKTYLVEQYEDEYRNIIKFDEKELKTITKINTVLEKYYDILEKNINQINVVEIQKEFNYCQFAHKYGRFTWNLNDIYYQEAAKQFVKIIYNSQSD